MQVPKRTCPPQVRTVEELLRYRRVKHTARLSTGIYEEEISVSVFSERFLFQVSFGCEILRSELIDAAKACEFLRRQVYFAVRGASEEF